MAPRDGFEPPARRLTVVCSTAELPGNMIKVAQSLRFKYKKKKMQEIKK